MNRYTVHNNNNNLIINADDFGFNLHIDQGIYQLLRTGKIKSTSVVINGDNINNAIIMINQFKNEDMEGYLQCSFGLHFNITQGCPLNDKLKGTVMAPEGKFIGKHQLYQIIDSISEEVVTQIQQQVRLQIKAFMKLLQRRPSHLDGHNHVTQCPRIAKSIATAMLQLGVYRGRALSEQLSTITVPMNHTFIKNYHKTKHIFAERHIISANRFVGLQSLGQLKVGEVETAFSQQQQGFKSVELMCHPGYPDPKGIPWIANPDRLAQLNQLKSQSFDNIRKSHSLGSYLDLKTSFQKSIPRMLIYSKLQKGTGNCTTTLRLKQMFQKIGFEVYLWNTDDKIDIKFEASDLFRFLLNFGINLILGVNVSRSAQIIHEAIMKIAVPYILMVAGTDANITFKTQQGLSRVQPAIRDCQCLISLSHGMKKITEDMLDQLKIDKQVYVITQSSCLSLVESSLEEQTWIKPQRQFILFPTSFRKVKCVHHVLSQLNTLIDKYQMTVIIAGPVIDQKYFQKCAEQLGKISYIGVVSKQLYKVYLKNCFAVINTSESQGMSCSILEAFQMRKPVLVRKNQGNQELVSHMVNGLIYKQPQEFLQQFAKLKEDSSLRQTLVQNSYSLFSQKYCPQRQFAQYQELIAEQYHSKLFNYKDVTIFNSLSIHPASEINAQLFDQIEYQFKDGDSLLDLGCGSGVFSIVMVGKTKQKVQLWLSDIKLSIVARSLYNLRQNEAWSKVEAITCVQSNWFEQLQNQKKFDVVLFNPPQSPFRIASSRLDKNGGPEATKHIESVLQYFSKHTKTTLYMLYSFMAWPSRFLQIQQKLNLKIVWQSTKGIHQIDKNSYNLMEENLTEYIIEHWKQRRAEIKLEGDIFEVPAIVYRIELG